MSVGVIVQEQHGRHKGRDEGKHGAVGGIPECVDIVHDSTDKEGLMRRQQPHPKHEQDARYAVHGAKVGQVPELAVVGAHDVYILRVAGIPEKMFSRLLSDNE